MVKGVIYAPFVALAIVIIGGIFISSRLIVSALAAVAFFAMIHIALVSSNIYFELAPDGKFRYFKRGEQKLSFDMTKCGVGYHRKSDTGFLPSHSLRLDIQPEGTTEKSDIVNIDCDALGLDTFMAMFQALDDISVNEPEVLSAAKSKEEE
jgi:hypothetical protein